MHRTAPRSRAEGYRSFSSLAREAGHPFSHGGRATSSGRHPWEMEKGPRSKSPERPSEQLASESTYSHHTRMRW